MARTFSVAEVECLAALVDERPDLTLKEIREVFSKDCSLMAVHAVHMELQRLTFRYKKTLKAFEQDREGIA